jgi:hypothetical protein
MLCVFTSVLCGVNKEVKENNNNNKQPNPIVERHLPTIASDAYGIGFVEETRTTHDQYCGCIATVSDRNCFTRIRSNSLSEKAFSLDLHEIIFSFVKNMLLGRAEKL